MEDRSREQERRRRARFVAWFDATYGKLGQDARAKFMADSAATGQTPLTKGRVAQLFDETQPFGELAARRLADRFGLPEDYFLWPLSEDAIEAGELIEELSDPKQRRQVIASLQYMVRLTREGTGFTLSPGGDSAGDETQPTRRRGPGR